MNTTTQNPFDSINIQLIEIKNELSAIASKVGSAPVTERKFFNIREAAEKLRVSKITLYRGTASGEIPSRKVGARTVIPASYFETKQA